MSIEDGNGQAVGVTRPPGPRRQYPACPLRRTENPVRHIIRLLLIIAALVPLTTSLPQAGAAPARQPVDDGNRAWSARPATPDGKPDRRTHFTLQGSPGQAVTDYVLITNSSKVAAAFDVYATDAFNTTTGAYDLLPAAKKPTDIGTWVTFPKPTVTIAAGASVTLQFQITVPANATPGDHAGGVVISLSSGTDVRLDSRVGVRLYLRVPGNLRPVLSVSYVQPDYHGVANPFGGGSVDVTYTVENTGNIRLQSHPKLTVKTALFGIGLAETKLPDLPELLPGGKVTYTGRATGVFPAGPEDVTIELSPYPDPEQPVGQAIPVFSGTETIWAVPWLLLLFLLVLGGSGYLLLRLFRWRGRARVDREVRKVLAATFTAAIMLTACGSSDNGIPYEDKGSQGRLAFYDAGGRRITSGNIDDKPFAHFAVSTEKAPPPYDKPGRKAALLAFQPRQGIDPAKWGGDFLTGSTSYVDAGHPTASGTGEDISLANFIAEYPPQWDGLIQLRMYLGAPQQPGLTEHYAAAEIRVKDKTWTLVRAAPDIPGAIPSGSPQ
jgi:hypothetical protein